MKKKIQISLCLIGIAIIVTGCSTTGNISNDIGALTGSGLNNNAAFYAEGGDITITKNNDGSTTYQTKKSTKVIIRDTEKSTAKNISEIKKIVN